MLRERGVEPEIVEYLKTPPSAPELKKILGQLKTPGCQSCCVKKRPRPPAIDPKALVGRRSWSRRWSQHPIVIERPIVISGGKAALGRPPEAVLSVL